MVLLRSIQFVSLLLSVSVCAAQGGQGPQGGFGGGGGVGGGFGGMQGGSGDLMGNTEVFNRSLFLSPGDRTEWTFEARENETVFARITSSVFDPAVAVHDEAGNKLAENDDIEPGNQMAQLVYAVPKPGKYKVVVTNYKGTAGGQFEIHTRRFLSIPLKLGEAQTAAVGNTAAWARIDIPKAGDYIVTMAGPNQYGLDIMKSNGQELQGQMFRGGMDARRRVTIDGPQTLFLNFHGEPRPLVRVAPVEVREIEIGATKSENLEVDQVFDWRVQVRQNDLIEIALPGNPDGLQMEAVTPPHKPDGQRLYTILQQPAQISRFVVAALSDGQIAFSVREAGGRKAPYQIRVNRVGKPWAGAGVVTDSLDWYEREFWTFDAKPGDVVKLHGASKTYHLYMTTMDPHGNIAQVAPVGKTPQVATNFMVRQGGRYVLSVSGGGIGDYQVTKEAVEPKQLPAGGSDGQVRADSPDVWRFSARQGQDFGFRISAEKLKWHLTVIGPNGAVYGSLVDADFLRLKVPQNGDYTIVVNATDGVSGAYRLKWIDLDK